MSLNYKTKPFIIGYSLYNITLYLLVDRTSKKLAQALNNTKKITEKKAKY